MNKDLIERLIHSRKQLVEGLKPGSKAAKSAASMAEVRAIP